MKTQQGRVANSAPVAGGVMLQRRCGACGQRSASGGQCAECDGKRPTGLQRAAVNRQADAGQAPPIVHDVLRSQGQPLDAASQFYMGARFGHDFSGVKVHTDGTAAESARSVNALAYTVGNDVVFGAGQYAPHTPAGRRTLAHELAHTIQQGGGLQRIPDSLSISSPQDALETEADRAAQAVAGGGSLTSTSTDELRVARDTPHSSGGDVVTGSSAVPAGGGTPAPAGGGSGAPAPTPAPAPAPPAAAPAVPSVSIGNFRNTGNTSADNSCPLCPIALGPSGTDGTNGMELRGDVTGHVATAQYDFKRTKERGTWKKVGGTWSQVTHVGPGADDDSHNSDESLTPASNHIYVIDTPGFNSLANPVGDASATEAVYKASFIETCNVKVGAGAWAQSSNSVEWHSISWLEKTGGTWQRKAGSSEIATGTTAVGTNATP
jgi:hypothetical protein